MNAYELIDHKKRGGEHDAASIRSLVAGITHDTIPDYQLAAWLMAVWHKGMSLSETVELTLAMRDSGDVLTHDGLGMPTADKHSTGGVGDKISLLLAPLAACLGLAVPMLSGRGLGHTGGTLDKLQAIPGYRADLSAAEMESVLNEVGCSILGQTDRIAPADRRLYALRDVTATVDCIPLIVSSILSKKLAAGPTHLVIDLKCGSGAFMQNLDDARRLAGALLHVGRAAGLKIAVNITDMGQPLGRAVGHSLEILEVLEGLKGRGPSDQRELTLALATEMGVLAGLGDRKDVLARCERFLDDGSALRRFEGMVRAHGGTLDVDAPETHLDLAPEVQPFVADRSGTVLSMRTDEVGWSVVDLKGGRRLHTDNVDFGVGLLFEAKRGARVQEGDVIARVFARSEEDAQKARERLRRAVRIGQGEAEEVPLILEASSAFA